MTHLAKTELDQLFADYQAPHPGASLAILHQSGVLQAAYGLADLEVQRPVTANTIFRLASVTKQFTAVALLMLVEQKIVAVTDPITRFFPQFPAYADSITLHHLLCHTSGLQDYEELLPADRTAQVHDPEIVELMAQQADLYFPVGTQYRYSNTAYAILSYLIETVTGMTFHDFLHCQIFQPLGMTQSFAVVPEQLNYADRAFGYSLVDGVYQRTDQSRDSAVLGDGGVYSSANDMLKWMQEIFEPTLISRKTRDTAWSPQSIIPEGGRYGYGWYLSNHNGQRMVWHQGSSVGFRNSELLFPDTQTAVLILTNRNEEFPLELALNLSDRIKGRGHSDVADRR